MKRLLLVSSSRCHPTGYLDHCEGAMKELFAGAKSIIFVPFARPSGMTHDEYTSTAKTRINQMGLEVIGLHEPNDPREALRSAEGVFVGGGNTFLLLKMLYDLSLVELFRQRIIEGMPYMGTSAGSNLAGLSIGTSNDMPIVHPPTFEAFGAVPFNLNPHFPVAKPDPEHKGETREDRIKEFHFFNDQPVLAIHEDGMINVEGSAYTLSGQRHAIWFRQNQKPHHWQPGETIELES